MSRFSSRWQDYTPAIEKLTKTPEQAAVKTSKSPKAVAATAEPTPAPALDANTLPRMPWQLERLLSAASSNVLEAELPGVPDAGRYTLAWSAAYLTGDRDEALARLWTVYRAWQGVN